MPVSHHHFPISRSPSPRPRPLPSPGLQLMGRRQPATSTPASEPEVICLDSEDEDSIPVPRKVKDTPSTIRTATSSRSPDDVENANAVQLESFRGAGSLQSGGLSAGIASGGGLGGFLKGFDRKVMEQERLARVERLNAQSQPGVVPNKRRLDELSESAGSSTSASVPPRPTKTLKTVAETASVSVNNFHSKGSGTPSAKEVESSTDTTVKNGATSAAVAAKVRNFSSSVESETSGEEDVEWEGVGGLGMQYPDGVVKRTFCEGLKRRGDDITIEEVLQRQTLQMAVLSAFQWDPNWILNKVDVRTTNLILVMQAKDEEEKSRLRTMFSVLHGISLVFPDMTGQINCMHSKLMLLFHKEYLRVAVPSANLVKYDWGGNNGIMENTVFLIDLPRYPRAQQPASPSHLTFFARELIYFCQRKGYPDNIIHALHRVDYSKTAPYALVHSVGGSQTKDDWIRTGYPGLANAVKTLGWQSEKAGLQLDFVTSSLGALNRDFLTNIYRAVMGSNGLKELQSRTGGKKPTRKITSMLSSTSSSVTSNNVASSSSSVHGSGVRGGMDPEKVETPWEEVGGRFRVYFPTHDTVVASRGGVAAGGTICFQSKWWNAPTFPKEVLRDCVGNRVKGEKGVLMHSKLIFARPPHPVGGVEEAGRRVHAFAYVGSANLSESAWGKLILDRTTKAPKLNLRNWECGVLVPVFGTTLPATSSSSFSLFSSHEPVSVSGEAGESGSETGPEDEDDEEGTLLKEDKLRERELRQTEREIQRSEPVGMEVFDGVVPVPMETPGKKIAFGRRPWFYSEG